MNARPELDTNTNCKCTCKTPDKNPDSNSDKLIAIVP